MKTLVMLLLLGVTGCTAYLYAYDPLIDLVGLNQSRAAALVANNQDGGEMTPATAPSEPPPLPPPPSAGTGTAANPTPPEMQAQTPAPTPAPVPTPAPAVATPPAMPPGPAQPTASAMTDSAPKPDADVFVPPTFLPLEELVKNWTSIPSTAFPREVRVMKPVEFVTVTPGGNKMSSRVPAGGLVQAMSHEGAVLVIAPSANSPARAQISMDDTDFKTVLKEVYEQWKISTTDRARRAYYATLAARKRAASNPQKDGSTATAGAPVRNTEGTYDILLASMKAGQVVDITPQNVRKWGEPVREEKDGQMYWTITMEVTVQTMFGPIDTQAVAYIRDGKVEKWLYASGEKVP